MLRVPALAGVLALCSGAAQAVQVQWTDWQTSSGTGGFTAIGQMAKLGGGFIDVLYNNPQGVAFFQSGSGTDYFAPRPSANSPYTSAWPGIGVDNIPPAAEMVALSRAGEQTLTFSEPVSNLYFAVISLNGNGYSFVNQDFDILSHTGADLDGAGTDAAGFWGSGTLTKNVVANFPDTDYQLIGSGEPHGVIRFAGSFDQITWRSLTAEFWNGFTVGIEGETAVVDPPPPPPPPSGEVPLPPTLALLGLAMAGLGLQRRRRRRA